LALPLAESQFIKKMPITTTTCDFYNPTFVGSSTNFQFSSSSCVSISGDISGSSTVLATFTYGEVINSVFLALIFAIAFYNLVKIKTHDEF